MPDISLFESISAIETPDNVSLDAFLTEVRDGRFIDFAITIRNIKDKKKRDEAKKSLPGVTFSGLFSVRRDDGLVQHSGFICIDLDDLEDAESVKKLLSQDRYVYACFTSISGTGLRVLFRINGAKHKESYYGLAAYLLRNYNLIPDPQSMVVSRSFYVTHDPDIYICPNIVPVFVDYVKETKIEKKEVVNFVFEKEDFSNMMKQIQLRRLNLCESYHDWMKIGFALSHRFGESGREYFHILSSMSDKYNQKQTDDQYKYCLRGNKKGEIATISTFYWYCKQAGLQVSSERTIKIKKAVLTGKSAGLKKEQIIENLAKFHKINDADELVNEIFDTASDLSDGDTQIEKLEVYISSTYNLKRNEITKYIERDGIAQNQSDLNSMFISAKKIIGKIDYTLFERLLISDFVVTYNPLIDYFQNLGGKKDMVPLPSISEPNQEVHSPLIDKLSETIINDEPLYTKYFVRKWIVGVVSAAFKIHSPLVLVLTGPQRTGKTEWFRRLFPQELKKYYAESKLDAGKDDDILMTQKLIIMDDEMGGKSKREAFRFKELTSKEYFSLREPYGRVNVDLQRIAVLCGTSNYKELLYDETGNTRIIPVYAKGINKDLYNSIDKNELFKEAYNLFFSGFDWRIICSEDINFLNQNSSTYEVVHMENELIAKYFKPFCDKNEQMEWLTSSEIKVEIDTITNQKCILDRIGKGLSRFGFEQKSVRKDGSVLKRWGVVRINRPTQQTGYIPPPNTF